MKPYIIVGCLMIASTAFAQQIPLTARVDSLKNLDNMPVITDTGNPAPMPVRKGAGTAVNMPTRRMPRSADSGENSQKLSDLLNDPLMYLHPDSSSREKFHKRQPPKRNR